MKAKTLAQLKRVGALFLVLCMLLSGMTIPTFGGSDSRPEEYPASVGTAGNGLTITKSVSEKKADGTYDLTIEAYAEGESKIVTKRDTLDIVLVLDVSGSMEDEFTTRTSVMQARKSQGYSWGDLKNKDYYILDGGEYYEVERSDHFSMGISKQDFNIHYVKDGVTYYLKGTGTTTTKPTANIKYNDTIWTGVLYEKTTKKVTQEKMQLLKDAANGFIDGVAANAEEYGLNHRISIVKFASEDERPNVGNETYGRNDYNYTQTVKTLTVANGNETALKNAINSLKPGGATAADKGFSRAANELKNSTNKKVIVFFTDGDPNHGSGFDSGVAKDTIEAAQTLKSQNTVIYSISALASTPSETSDSGKFLRYVSSEYPNASGLNNSGTKNPDGKTYYYNVNESEDSMTLDGIFSLVLSEEVETTAKADETAKLVDNLTGYFDFVGTPTVKVAACTGKNEDDTYTWGALQDVSGVTASYNSDKNKVTATGFDYIDAANLVTEKDGVMSGKKLVIICNIKLDPNAAPAPAGTEWLPTNTGAEIDANGNTALSLTPDTPYIKVDQVVPYTIKFLKQNTTGGYDEDTDARITSSGKLYSTFSAPEGYANKYASEYYTFAGGVSSKELTLGTNVIELKYNKMTTSYTVKREFKLTTLNAVGEPTVTYPTAITEPAVTGFVGDTATITPEETYTYTTYGVTFDLKSSDPSSNSLELKQDATQNVFVLKYEQTVDNTVYTSATIQHVYHTYAWKLNAAGKYTVQETNVSDPQNINSERAKKLIATKSFTANDDEKVQLAGYSNYDYRTDNVDTIPSLSATASENVITLHYDNSAKPDDNRVAATVTVNHHYTKTITYIDENGERQTKNDPNGAVVPVTVSTGIYVGETWNAFEANTYLDDTYTSDDGNAAKCEPFTLEASQTIDLYYTATETPEETYATVKHHYITITETTVPDVVDGEVVGTKIEYSESEDSVDPVKVSDLYVNEAFTAAEKAKSGYTFDRTKSDDQNAVALADGATVVNLNYYKTVPADDREEVELTVTHIYTTNVSKIVDGEVAVVSQTEVPSTVVTPEGTFQVGDSFTAEAVTTHGGHSDWTVKKVTPKANIVLQNGSNNVTFNYERSASELVATKYTVVYQYRTKVMHVVDGVAQYQLEEYSENDGDVTVGPKDGYKDQVVSFENGAKTGYTMDGSSDALTQTLGANASENVYTILWIANEPVDLNQYNVTVVDHYITETINESNVSDGGIDNPVSRTAVTKYDGESYAADIKPEGFSYTKYDFSEATAANADNASQDEETKTVTFDVNGDVTVNFYYYKKVNNSHPVKYIITDVYKAYTWDGNLIADESSSHSRDEESSYKGKTVTATPAFQGVFQSVESCTVGDTEIASPYSVTLTADSTEIVFLYTYQYERADVAVSVIHNYYANEVSEDVTPLTFTYVPDPAVKEDAEYTAPYRYENEGIQYTPVSSDPTDRKIETVKGGTYTITINYVRKDVSYSVIHSYYTNGSLTGSSDPISKTGKFGDVISAASIDKVNDFEGNNYAYVDNSGDITLDSTAKSITLNYARKTSNKVVVTILDEDGKTIGTVPETHEFGDTYSITTPDIPGYDTPKDHTFSGTMGDKDIYETITYTAKEYTLTVNYVFAEGGTAAPTVQKPVKYGQEYSVSSPAVTGFGADKAVVSGTMPARDVTETVTYTRGEFQLTVYYVFEDNTTAHETFTGSYDFDTDYNIGSPIIEGFVPDLASVMGKKLAKAEEFTVVYSKDEIGNNPDDPSTLIPDGIADKYEVVVTYNVVNGTWSNGATASIKQVYQTKNAEGDITPAPALENIPVGMKANSGYTGGAWDAPAPTTATVAVDGAEYTYRFVVQSVAPSATYTLTVHYLFADEEEAPSDEAVANLQAAVEAAPSVVKTLSAGAKYSVTSPAVEGYTPDRAVVEGTMPNKNVDEYVYYSAVSSGNTEIDDEDTPLSGDPLEDLDDEDVPLADLPETGDNGLVGSLFGIITALLALVFVIGKKKEEEVR